MQPHHLQPLLLTEGPQFHHSLHC
uniref:Uncharacterized protein n=1 Tax=Arundo donax TaxID=35708 RepID=A0A0A8Y907_ARUDO